MKLLTRTITALAAIGTLTAALLAGAAPASAATGIYISVYPPPDVVNVPQVIDVRGGPADTRAVVQLYPLRKSGNVDNQRWIVTRLPQTYYGLGVYELKRANSQQCLDMSLDTTPGNGSKVYQYPCAGTENQQWIWSAVRTGNNWGYLYNLYAANHQNKALCLDVTDKRYDDLTPLQVWSCNTDPATNWNQRWNIF